MEINQEALRARAPENPVLQRYAEIADALKGVPELDRLRRDLGVPPLVSFGMSREEIPAVIAGSRAGSMNYNPIALTDAELEQILLKSLE
jgi:alcohol dehydrogenase class IV